MTILPYITTVLSFLALFLALSFLWRRLRRAQEAERHSDHRLKSYLMIINRYVVTSRTDLQGNIIEVSDAFCKISGYSKQELIGNSHNLVRHPNTDDHIYQDLWQTIQQGKSWQGEMCNRRKDGSLYWVQASITPDYDLDGKMRGFIAVHQDITDHKMVIELSIRDALTGLYNRRHFNQNFEQLLQRSKSQDGFISLMILDIDNFKKYNDTYGHQKGDAVLSETAAVIQRCCDQQQATCYRLGGEEFAVLSNLALEPAQDLAEEIRAQIEDLNIEHINNANLGKVSISIGLYSCRIDRFSVDEPDEIFRIADQALYQAKEMGRNRVNSANLDTSSIELF